jgi:DNA adenine methylase
MSAAYELHTDEPTPSPFLKWAGGKGQLLRAILPRLPQHMETYYEPFVGGGAVFFALAAQERFSEAILADRNPALAEAYRVVKSSVEELIDVLRHHAEHACSEEYYYEVRAAEPATAVERVARLIFLNKTCFNGLYRVNRKGRFNVPFGRYKNPRVCNEVRLRAASRALARATILVCDFESAVADAGRDDAVYFDPPYVPLSASSSFTSYSADPFGAQEHERLSRVYGHLCRRGVPCVLSNSDCELTRKLYERFDVRTVSATRAINSVAGKRGAISEILVVGARAAKKAEMRDSAIPAATAKKRAHR